MTFLLEGGEFIRPVGTQFAAFQAIDLKGLSVEHENPSAEESFRVATLNLSTKAYLL